MKSTTGVRHRGVGLASHGCVPNRAAGQGQEIHVTVNRRQIIATGTAALAFPGIARASARRTADRAAGMLLMGFIGDNPDAEGADIVADHLANGRIGGVLFLRHNVRSREGAEGLAARFREIAPDAFLALDQEGGAVQRLNGDLGYTPVPRAHVLAQAQSPSQAEETYRMAAREFTAAGFNMNLAPVADVQDDANGVIGRWGRGYGTDGETIAAYAGAFIDAFEAEGAVCAVKHFPGHGRSTGDSHEGFVDISQSWSENELD
ncbi:MAG TPA: glycosyl hydrolase, partial [Alphaproteobacteria bacterium]|nr:glycosyl hydrolase [Alphaproteobacteria bacterium]